MQDLWPSWQRAARELDGSMRVAVEADCAPRLRAWIGGVMVTASVGRGVSWISARAPEARGWRCAISELSDFPLPDSFSVDFGRSLLGPGRTVRTDDAPLARLWLDRAVCLQIGATRGYHFVLSDGRALAFSSEREVDGERLAAAARAVSALARRGREIRREWSAVARDIGGQLRVGGGARSVSIRVPAHGGLVDVDAFFGGLSRRGAGAGVLLRMRAERPGRAGARFVLRDRDAGPPLSPAPPAGLSPVVALAPPGYELWSDDTEALDRHAIARLARARPSLVIGDCAHVTAFFRQIDGDRPRLRAGISLVGGLAAAAMPSSGPYR